MPTTTKPTTARLAPKQVRLRREARTVPAATVAALDGTTLLVRHADGTTTPRHLYADQHPTLGTTLVANTCGVRQTLDAPLLAEMQEQDRKATATHDAAIARAEDPFAGLLDDDIEDQPDECTAEDSGGLHEWDHDEVARALVCHLCRAKRPYGKPDAEERVREARKGGDPAPGLLELLDAQPDPDAPGHERNCPGGEDCWCGTGPDTDWSVPPTMAEDEATFDPDPRGTMEAHWASDHRRRDAAYVTWLDANSDRLEPSRPEGNMRDAFAAGWTARTLATEEDARRIQTRIDQIARG